MSEAHGRVDLIFIFCDGTSTVTSRHVPAVGSNYIVKKKRNVTLSGTFDLGSSVIACFSGSSPLLCLPALF